MGSARMTQNGPDWADIAQMVRAMQDLHVGSTITIEMMSDGAHYAGSLTAVVKATAPQLERPGQVWKQVVQVSFPGNQFKTMESAVYYGLHRMDALMLRELWHQEKFA